MAGPQRRSQTVSSKQAMKSMTNGSMKRLMSMVFKKYWLHIIFVIIGILGSAIATVNGTLFMQKLIDDYIMPLMGSSNPNYGPLFAAILKIAGIYLIGIVCAYMYNIIMVFVGQGTMRTIRLELFEHMEKLPIRYFDTHAHGDIMSIYTNDTDTLRQFIGMSFPQLINSIVTIVSVFISMCILNIPLTILTVAMVFIIMKISGKAAVISGKYFSQQQKNLGRVNGYIEEILCLKKLVMVFFRE